MEIEVNYLAVLLGGVAYMIVGFLWYGPLFGKMWQRLMGFTEESIKSMSMTPMKSMILGFISALVMSYVLAHFVGFMGVATLGDAMQLACWIWLGFMATQTLGVYLWEGKPFKLFVLNAANQFVALHIMAAVIFWMM